jgi:cell division protein FtsI (penicillin-binding protein 3)
VVVICLLAAAGLAFWVFHERLELVTMIRAKISSLTALVDEPGLPRGAIFDRNLKQLAVTLDRVSVYARTQEIRSVAQTVEILGAILSLDEKELRQNLESTNLRVWVAENISLEQEIAVKSKRLPGIYLQREEKRFYPHGPVAAHILGYAENGIGLAGVEHYYDKVLAGGMRDTEEDQRFSSLDLVLTLDIKLQEILDAILAELFQEGAVTSALACMIDGKSGAVLASTQLPSFDPNTFAKFSKEVMANRLAMAIPVPTRFRTFLRDVALLDNGGEEEGEALPWSVRALGDDDTGGKLRLWERLRLSDNPLTDFHAISQPGEAAEAGFRPALMQDPSLAMVPESATPLNILAAWTTILNQGQAVWPHVIAKGSAAAEEGSSAEKNEPPLPAEVGGLFRSMARIGAGNAAFFHDELPVVKIVGTSSQVQLLEVLLVTIPAGESDLNLLLAVERNPPGASVKNGKKSSPLEQLVEEKVERLSILQQVATTVADVIEPEISEEVNYEGEKSDQGETRRDEGERARIRSRLTIMPDLHGQSLRQGLRLLQGGQLRLDIRGTGKIVSQKPGAGTPLTGVKEVVLILEKSEEVTPETLAKQAAAGK